MAVLLLTALFVLVCLLEWGSPSCWYCWIALYFFPGRAGYHESEVSAPCPRDPQQRDPDPAARSNLLSAFSILRLIRER